MTSPFPDGLRWIFLDAGNTLVHLDYARVAGIVREAFGVETDPDAMEDAEPRARVHVDVESPGADGERERWRTYFWTILSAGGWPDRARVPDVLRELFARNKVFSLWSVPARGAAATLERLRDDGYELAVISNSDGSVAAMLERLGLARFLRFALDSRVVGVEKPDPRIFRMALDRSGALPEESLYVGDMFHIDVLGARGAGMHGALLDPAGLHAHRECHRLAEIAELPARLH
jgi:HAD superfamily hydrolase (TIGR01509 family)